jgi:hypothetical protein
MTLSERLRSQIADITPRIPDHNRRELEEIARAIDWMCVENTVMADARSNELQRKIAFAVEEDGA